MFRLLLILAFWMGLIVHDSDAGSNPEIFVKGRKYDSLSEYKKSRFEDRLDQIAPWCSAEDRNNLIKAIEEKYTLEEIKSFSDKQFQGIIEDWFRQKNVQAQPIKDSKDDIQDLNFMLEDFKKNKPDVKDLKLDQKKIKTLLITPGKSKEQASENSL